MSETNHDELLIEQKRVNEMVREIEKVTGRLENHAGKVSADVLGIRKNFWDDVTVNFDEPDDLAETYSSIKQQAALLSERERSHTQLDKQMKTLSRLKNSPYFGRIDFHEEGEPGADSIYVGVASFMDQEEENFLIYDWRAPISSLYYDYPPGPAQYETPSENISGEIVLKRQFVIRNAEIKAMFDTGVTIGDEMLQEVLGNHSDSQMKNIVATIQKEQNQIIRNVSSKLLIVQGVAGSGKTSAAMQRVAYLLYRYRNIIKSENIMLFSPNPLFNSYVSTVLPELGEENMQQSTFQEYLMHRLSREFELEDPFGQMEYLLSDKEDKQYEVRLGSIRYKASLDFKMMIDEYADHLSERGLLFKDILFRKKCIVTKQEIHDYFYSLDKNYSIPNRVHLLREWILKELKLIARKERSKQWVEDQIQFLDKEDYMQSFKQLQKRQKYNEDTFDDFEKEQKWLAMMVVNEKFKPLITAVKKYRFIDMAGIYEQLFTSKTEMIKPENWEEISKLTSEMLTNAEIAYEDATPFAYLQDLIEGRKSNTGIKHVFIDEAQDYSPFQFAFIKQLFPYSRMTLLGDFNQAIFSGATGASSILIEGHDQEESERIVLTRTYRSTKPIVEFTSELIEAGRYIQPFNRDGNKPELIKAESPEELINLIGNKLTSLLADGSQTVAVICKTAQESKEVFDSIKDHFPVWLIEKGTVSYEKGVLVIPSYLAKGIEFDAVIVHDISRYSRESERKLFYTVCTRAMHELYLFTPNGISP